MVTLTTKVVNKILLAEKIPPVEKANNGGIEFNKVSIKNLGLWLGLLTLARNKPIIIRDLDIKNLLITSFFNQRLEILIPVVCKILMAGSQR